MKLKVLLPFLSIAAVFIGSSALARNVDISVVRVPNGGIQPQAAMHDTGTLHLLYYLGDPIHGDLFYVKSSNSGATWSSPLRVNSEPGTAIAAGTIRGGQIVIGRNGRVHIAWNGSKADSKGPKNPESGQREAPMFYSRLNDARAAFEPQRSVMTCTFRLGRRRNRCG